METFVAETVLIHTVQKKNLKNIEMCVRIMIDSM